jgi:hypothetical protein
MNFDPRNINPANAERLADPATLAEIEQILATREVDGAKVVKLMVGVTVHEQHVGGHDLDGRHSNGELYWLPWAALLATRGKTPSIVKFPLSTGHDMRGIGKVLADRPNFFAFEHHSGGILFTITADAFFHPQSEMDFR